MALESAFQGLHQRLQQLRESIDSLRLTAVEDRPAGRDTVLVDRFGDAALELLGWLDDALVAAGLARQSVEHPTDLGQAARRLTTCQERYNRIEQRYWADLVSYEQLAELAAFRQERGGEWAAWSAGLGQALDDCRQPLYDVKQALFGCWQEVTERVGAMLVSVQTTTIGQQIATSEAAGAFREGVT